MSAECSVKRKHNKAAVRPALTPKSENIIQPTSQLTYQVDCFTPKRALQRTPPKQAATSNSASRNGTRNTTPKRSSPRTKKTNAPPHIHLTPESEACHTPTTQHTPARETNSHFESRLDNIRDVQDDCFTPRHSLPRSPQKQPQRTISPTATNGKPSTKKTPSRTPNRSAHVTRQTNARRSLHTASKSTIGTRARKDISPLSSKMKGRTETQNENSNDDGFEKKVQAPCFTPRRSLRRSPPSTPARNQQLESSPSRNEDLIDAAPPQSHWELPRTPQALSPVHIQQVQVDPVRSTRRTPSVHPLSHSNRATPQKPTSTLTKTVIPSGDITENDRAFLEEMKYNRQQKELQAKSIQLEKALKTVAEQKELLQHEAVKIDQDIEDMKTKYQETVDSVHMLIAHSSLKSPHSTTSVPRHKEQESAEGLTDAHVVKLRKMNQLTSAQLDKTGRELKGKMHEVERRKEELQHEIREHEQREKDTLLEAESRVRSAQGQRTELEQKMQKTAEEHAAMEAQIQELKSTLETLSIEKVEEREREKENPRSLSELEKQRAERRLQRIIKRCELYVKRHQMLKEMGIR